MIQLKLKRHKPRQTGQHPLWGIMVYILTPI